MRPAVLCLIAFIGAPALAQEPGTTPSLPPTDGTATLTGAAAEAVRTAASTGGYRTIEDVRGLMAAILSDARIGHDEKDLLAELAAGREIDATADGEQVRLAVLPADLQAWPRVMLAPPNLHQLWHVGGSGAVQLVEMARWGPLMEQRIARFIGNQLDDAWKKSNLLNAYSPYVGALGAQWNAFKTLPGDSGTRAFAHGLLSAGVAYGLQKAQAEGRPPPEAFLYAWVEDPRIKQGFIDAER